MILPQHTSAGDRLGVRGCIAATAAGLVAATSTVAVGSDCTTTLDPFLGLNENGSAVSAFATYDGELYAGGSFNIDDGESANRIARWSGAGWHPVGSGMDGGFNPLVAALTVYDGDLIAAGRFENAGGQPVNNIARWDGTEWHPLGDGVDGDVQAVIEYDGDLIVGGWFDTAGGQTVDRIARWDGASWHSMGGLAGGNGTLAVDALAIYEDDLIVGGNFTSVDGVEANYIARWDGASWQPIDTGMNNSVRALAVFDGDLYAAGFFTEAGGTSQTYGIARWDGVAWHKLGLGLLSSVAGQSLAVYNDALYVGGNFTRIYTDSSNSLDIVRLARWDGQSWDGIVDACPGSVPNGCGVNNWVEALHVHDGRLFIGGTFNFIFGEFINHVAAWEESCTSPADLTGDGTVNVFDLLELLGEWGECPGRDTRGSCAADLTGDGTVNVFDLLELLGAWG